MNKKYLATFSGKYGDILWSLATVKELSYLKRQPIDFCCMPQYENLLPLLQSQPYIHNAFVNKEWIIYHSCYGDQPWQPQNHAALAREYDQVWHLTYQGHPGIGAKRLPLIDFVADQQGMILHEPVIPFLFVPPLATVEDVKYVAYAFNEQYAAEKSRFLDSLQKAVDIKFVDCNKLSWLDALAAIKTAVCFVGCRSANWVMAHGVGQKHIFLYEPHPARHPAGHLGDVFGNPHGHETAAPMFMPPEVAAQMAASLITILQSIR